MPRVPAFEIYNMDKPDPYNETMTFQTRAIAERVQARVGGQIRPTFVHVAQESK